MTELELLQALAEPLPEVLYEQYHRRDLCILATRVAIEVGRRFGIVLRPVPCKVVIYNAQFRKHLDAKEKLDVGRWHKLDGSHSIGIGCGHAGDEPGRWNGHLIARGEEYFADFSASQMERLNCGIITGDSIIIPIRNDKSWELVNEHGTHVEYDVTDDKGFYSAADWHRRSNRAAAVDILVKLVEKINLAHGLKLV